MQAGQQGRRLVSARKTMPSSVSSIVSRVSSFDDGSEFRTRSTRWFMSPTYQTCQALQVAPKVRKIRYFPDKPLPPACLKPPGKTAPISNFSQSRSPHPTYCLKYV